MRQQAGRKIRSSLPTVHFRPCLVRTFHWQPLARWQPSSLRYVHFRRYYARPALPRPPAHQSPSILLQRHFRLGSARLAHRFPFALGCRIDCPTPPLVLRSQSTHREPRCCHSPSSLLSLAHPKSFSWWWCDSDHPNRCRYGSPPCLQSRCRGWCCRQYRQGRCSGRRRRTRPCSISRQVLSSRGVLMSLGAPCDAAARTSRNWFKKATSSDWRSR